MTIILLSTLQLGYKFCQTWPKKEAYLTMFPQTRTVRLTELAMISAPAIAFITAYLQLSFLGQESLHTALAMSLLIISIPVHGYFILGKQANEVLPLGLKSWYKEIEQQLKKEGLELSKPKHKSKALTYMDLAELLKQLFEKR